MKLELDPAFSKNLSRVINNYEFQVGVLNDKPHYLPKAEDGKAGPAGNLKTYAGGPATQQSLRSSGKTTAQILVDNMYRLGRNILLEPFEKTSSDIIKFTNAFLNMAIAKRSPKRVENLLQAIVRNPILKQEYGSNKAQTARAKGFNRHLIDTAQMFRAIRAKIKRVKRV